MRQDSQHTRAEERRDHLASEVDLTPEIEHFEERLERRLPGRVKVTLIVLVCAVLALAVVFYAYTSDFCEASDNARACMTAEWDDGVVVTTQAEGVTAFLPVDMPDKDASALLFYPGGKVEAAAYAPLLRECAEKGVACVLVEMPFNLAVFDSDAAADVMPLFPQVTHWYLGGHSLGGVMACSFAAKNVESLEGLVMLASYSTDDLSRSGLKCVSLFGSNDTVLSIDAYQENRANFPKGFREIVIEGGNHCQFGDYGLQDGDSVAAISPEEQRALTADAVVALIKE